MSDDIIIPLAISWVTLLEIQSGNEHSTVVVIWYWKNILQQMLYMCDKMGLTPYGRLTPKIDFQCFVL